MSQIIRDITEIARCGAEYRAVQLTPMGLKGCHASYLSEICADPGISQDKLAQRICINKSNIARQVAFLEEEGFVTRSPAPQDKRVMQLYPTEKTLALLPQITAVHPVAGGIYFLLKSTVCRFDSVDKDELSAA